MTKSKIERICDVLSYVFIALVVIYMAFNVAPQLVKKVSSDLKVATMMEVRDANY